MASFEPETKKIKLNTNTEIDESDIIQQRMINRLIKDKLILKMMNETTEIIDQIIDSNKYNTKNKIDPNKFNQINICHAKETFLQSNLNILRLQTESHLTEDIKQIIDESIIDMIPLLINNIKNN